MTEEELEQLTTDQIDRERAKNAILALEIESMIKAVDMVENVSGFPGIQRERARDGLYLHCDQ